MKNTPSALRWLANKRARVSFDLGRLEIVARDVHERLDNLRLDLHGLDRTIKIFDPALKPETIEDVHPHRKIGGRGRLKTAMIEVLQENAPEWTATDLIELTVSVRLALTFETAAARKRWYENVFRAQLRKLTMEGLVERLQDPTVCTSEMGRWRWRTDVRPSLSELSKSRS